MPQPYLKVKRGGIGPFDLTPGAIRRYPDLAAKLGLVIANWSYIDTEIELILVTIVGARAELVAAMYAALSGQAAQEAVVRAVAERELSGDDLALFRAILKLSVSPRKQRNTIAHGVWGVADDISDALLLLDPMDALKESAFSSNLMSTLRRATQEQLAALVPALREHNFGDHLMVYRPKDFEDLNDEITRIAGYWSRFRGLLTQVKMFGREDADTLEWREKLCREPPIQEVLASNKQNPKNAQI